MESKTNWCVYMHENRFNGKRYIGITGQKPTRRWQNGKHYDYNVHFYAAIQKYGWDGFRHEILFTELTQEEAERLEIELIAKYETQDYRKGYNTSSGGSANAGWHHTEDARARMSASRMGRVVSPETREKLRQSNTDKVRSAEARAKMSAAKLGKKGRKWTEQERLSHLGKRPAEIPAAWKAVKQLTLDGEFVAEYPSRKEAAKQTGVRPNGIAACCRGVRAKAGGYRWVDANEAVTVDG